MTELTLSLVTLAIAATLQPPQVIAMIILLGTRHGTANGLAYIGGMTAFRLALGLFPGYFSPAWRAASKPAAATLISWSAPS